MKITRTSGFILAVLASTSGLAATKKISKATSLSMSPAPVLLSENLPQKISTGASTPSEYEQAGYENLKVSKVSRKRR